MAIGKRFNVMQSAKLATFVVAASMFVSYIFNLIGVGTTQLFSAFPSVSVVSGTVGQKFLGLLGGIIPISEMWGFAVLALFVSSMILILAGEFLLDNVKLPSIKNVPGLKPNTIRLFNVIIYGAIIPYVILVGIVAPSVMTFIGVGINTLATAFIATLLAGLLKVKI